ncbi:MAG: hypothetical protein ACUVTU_09065 [Desulfurispora sp.]|uniref:hypothetical protein n=1 Tax=Desulfurispora sp. TaxID=3014275 RepID=UPI004049E590
MLQKILLTLLTIAFIILGYSFHNLREINGNLMLRMEQLESILKNQVAECKQLNEGLYLSSSKDKYGKTPVDVLDEYLQAERQRDYWLMYQLTQVPDDISYEQFIHEMKRDNSFVEHYDIEDFLLYSKDRATVFLSYKIRIDNKVTSFDWEPWSCIKENGIWKIRWLPRQ